MDVWEMGPLITNTNERKTMQNQDRISIEYFEANTENEHYLYALAVPVGQQTEPQPTPRHKQPAPDTCCRCVHADIVK